MMGIDMSNFKMIYKDQVFNVININPVFGEGKGDSGIEKPKFINAMCIDENGEIIIIDDEAWMFKFVRR